jgi:hypothetical protein
VFVNIIRQAHTFKISGVIKLGPGEENEAATGARGSTVVSVCSRVPTGLLQNRDQDYCQTSRQLNTNVGFFLDNGIKVLASALFKEEASVRMCDSIYSSSANSA